MVSTFVPVRRVQLYLRDLLQTFWLDFLKRSIAEENLSALETIGVINMGQYSGSKIKYSVSGHVLK